MAHIECASIMLSGWCPAAVELFEAVLKLFRDEVNCKEDVQKVVVKAYPWLEQWSHDYDVDEAFPGPSHKVYDRLCNFPSGCGDPMAMQALLEIISAKMNTDRTARARMSAAWLDTLRCAGDFMEVHVLPHVTKLNSVEPTRLLPVLDMMFDMIKHQLKDDAEVGVDSFITPPLLFNVLQLILMLDKYEDRSMEKYLPEIQKLLKVDGISPGNRAALESFEHTLFSQYRKENA